MDNNNKVIKLLITGGTGSLAKSFVNELLMNNKFKKFEINIFSRNEYLQYLMELQYPCINGINYLLGDIRDRCRVNQVVQGMDLILHCAAIKHIDKANYNPYEAIQTNIIGAQNLVNAAVNFDVKKVIAISSDKAVNPTTLYGSTKLCSDYVFVNANLYSKYKTAFSVIRFGNFWDSSGSVIEKIQQHAKENTSFPLMHENSTRFFISLKEASKLIIDVFAAMEGCEIFTPKMLSFKIIDILKDIYNNLSTSDFKYHLVGLRPGEKLHEDLILKNIKNTIECDKWYVTYPSRCKCSDLPEFNIKHDYNSYVAYLEQKNKTIEMINKTIEMIYEK